MDTKEPAGGARTGTLNSGSEIAALATSEDRWGLLSLPAKVYADRLAQVQADVSARGLRGVLLFDPENIFWLTGYQTIGYFTFQAVFIAAEGHPIVIGRIVNRDLALAHPTIGGFEPVTDTSDHVEVLGEFLMRRAPGASVGIETGSWYLKVADFERLRASVSCQFHHWGGVIETWRPEKHPLEIDSMRHAARAAEEGLRAAIDAIEPGKTENDIAAAMFQANIAAGSEYLGHPPLVVAGETTALCFAMWRRREIRAGDVVLLEAAGCVNRMHAMLSRPVIVGEPTDEQQEAADALQGVLEAAIDSIRPGLIAGDVDRICRSVVEAKGLGQYFRHRAAYGIGIGFPPNWSEGHIYAIRPDDPLVLKPNMTFHVIPALFKDSFGMCFSDSVRVTDTGCELLTNFPRRLFTVDA
jgi:Xaa-Pro dipeptidase